MDERHGNPQHGQTLPAAQQPQVLNVFPQELIQQVLGIIQQRADLIAAAHQLSDVQAASAAVFKAFGAGMAVRQYLPTLADLKRNDRRDVLLFDVPQAATSARVWSTGGVADLHSHIRDDQGHMPVPDNLRSQQIRRVEFYDATGKLIAIAGAEAPPPPAAPQGSYGLRA